MNSVLKCVTYNPIPPVLQIWEQIGTSFTFFLIIMCRLTAGS